jgi:hypothetical protein
METNTKAKDRYQFDLIAKGFEGSPMEGVYRKIGERYRNAGVSDAPTPMRFTGSDIDDIRDAQWDHIKDGMTSDALKGGTPIMSMEDVRNRMTVSYDRLAKSLGRGKSGPLMKGETIDSFFNEVSGIGTGIDPGSYNDASIPISINPQEATAYYSNGGIAGGIIDKKFTGIFAQGYLFEGLEWDEEECKEMKEYAESLNFQEQAESWWRDGGCYGGALLIPALYGDNPVTYMMTEKELARQGMLDKGCISRFWEADRWNSVLIPDYDISAADYLTPKEFMIPIAGLTVATWRMGLARPKRLPYWGTLRQMGWGISDFPSFMPSLLAYEMGIRAIPIISQQLSLVYLQAPLDAIISTSGLNAAKKIQKDNEAAISQWSMLHPKMLNMFGDLKSIERHFTDFDKLILLLKEDAGAKSGISHTILFNELQSGMDEKSYDITLKQTETVRRSSNAAKDQLQPIVRMLVFGRYGYDSPQAKKADKLHIKFDSPVEPTTAENNETLTAGVNALNGFLQGGMNLMDSFTMVKKFIPEFELPDDVKKRIEVTDDTEQEVDESAKKSGLFDNWPGFGRKRK